MMRVYAFDFDGTITTKDTLIEFIRYAKGSTSLLRGLLIFSPLLVLMKLKLCSNGDVKQRLFAHYFKGINITEFNKRCELFADDNKQLLRTKAVMEIERAVNDGVKVLIVSASIDNWVEPFFKHLPDIDIIGTKIEVVDGKVTGKFLTKNCYGQEKVNRIKEIFPSKAEYELTAFGDSRGDKEMIEYADKGYYKPFR